MEASDPSAPAEEQSRVRVLVSGRVQGVGFRVSCFDRAVALGLAGLVRNLPDGRVEAYFEGAEPQLAAMLEWCAIGPPAARVDKVTHQAVGLRHEPHFRIE